MGFTPLHSAAGKGHEAAINALLDAGADPDARTENGRHPAAPLPRLKAMKPQINALLEAGADPDARSRRAQPRSIVIPKDSPLIGTPVYWRLKDARWN